jgi:2-dehydro-3-deoxy-D-arabinonate dehydratase
MAMKLYRTKSGVVVESGNQFYILSGSWKSIINRPRLFQKLIQEINDSMASPMAIQFINNELLPPIDEQEVWAAGVTYFRSKKARMDESKESGASVFYDKVYDAERPEIFFKATPHRVVGHNQPVRIRKDSTWNVPEPELTLFITSEGTIEGYTIGNDMSSRSIEGENPLYLPQAKSWDKSAALGPCLLVQEKPLDPSTGIQLAITRNGADVFNGSATLSQMKRTFPELAQWLTREASFPSGVYLMTGTCLVPEDGFTLMSGDVIKISIDGIGNLTNPVE